MFPAGTSWAGRRTRRSSSRLNPSLSTHRPPVITSSGHRSTAGTPDRRQSQPPTRRNRGASWNAYLASAADKSRTRSSVGKIGAFIACEIWTREEALSCI